VANPAKTILLSTGAEAVENAVKVARAYTGRLGIVSFSGGFHGRTLMGMALTGKVIPYKKGFGPFPAEVYNVAFPNTYHGVSGEQSLAALKALFKYTADPSSIAAIIIEPVQGGGRLLYRSVRLPARAEGTMRRARYSAYRRRNSDGFRPHRKNVWARARRLKADVATMAKSLAGGFPLAAVTGRANVMDASNPRTWRPLCRQPRRLRCRACGA
jgi:4-aminobutyrate aminotransferase-like enzyme